MDVGFEVDTIKVEWWEQKFRLRPDRIPNESRYDRLLGNTAWAHWKALAIEGDRIVRRWIKRWERRTGKITGLVRAEALREPGTGRPYIWLTWQAAEPHPDLPEAKLRQALEHVFPPRSSREIRFLRRVKEGAM